MADSVPAPHAQLWMNGACAILTVMTRRVPRHDSLGGAPKNPESIQTTRKILANSWDIADADKLRSTLTWLRDEGHRADRDPRADDGLGPNGLLAWDYVRLIAVAGWGYVADFIAYAEAYQFIVPAAKALQQAYGSWNEMGQAYVKGTFNWSEEAGAGCQKIYDELVKLPTSPWRLVPWGLDLEMSGTVEGVGAKRQISLGMYGVAMAAAVALIGGIWFTVGRSVVHDVKQAVGQVNAPERSANGPRAGAAAPAHGLPLAAAGWDGKTPLVCGGSQQITVENVTSELEKTPPVLTAGNCHLTLKNVNLKSAIALSAGGNSVVDIEGGSLTGSKLSLSAVGNASVTLHGTRVTGQIERLANAKVSGP